MFSGKNSSSARASLDDENYDFSASRESTWNPHCNDPVVAGWKKWITLRNLRKENLMRYLVSFAALALVLGSLAGCKVSHAHGVCDCEFDDYCSSRSPWVRFGPAGLDVPVAAVPVTPAPGADFVPPAPAKSLPDLKKKDL
jgi:hypothetical protein